MRKVRFSFRMIAMSIIVVILATGCADHSEPPTKPEIWLVTTIAGSSTGSEDGKGTMAKFNQPTGLAVSSDNNLFVTDYSNNRIRKITSSGIVSTEAGTGEVGFVDGSVYTAQFDEPVGIAVAADGTMYVTDRSRGKIRKISNGVVSTLAGGTGGNSDGIGSQANFNTPTGITIGNDGSLYIADTRNNSIRRVTTDGVVTTFAGSKTSVSGLRDGFRSDALFDQPVGICADFEGALYITEDQNQTIRKIASDGMVTTVAGTGEIGFRDGKASEARFYFPYGIAVSSDGTLYVADQGNNRIRKISKSGEVTTIAGSTYGYNDGEGSVAQFFSPSGIVIATDGSLIISDTNNDRVRSLTLKN